MADIRSLIPFFAADIVAVFDQDFNQVFRQARALKAVVKESAKVMEHPVETGATITDHRVILPVEIELSLIVQAFDYADVYKTIRQYYLNATLLTVQTKSDTYSNQLISSMPHEEDPSTYDTLAIALTLKQVQFATAIYSVRPKSPQNSSRVNRGTQNGATPTPKQSAAVEAVDYFSGSPS